MMTTPSASWLDKPSFFARGPRVNPWTQTVINTSAKVRAVNTSASLYPSSVKIDAKYPATVSARIPLGATQPINVFSRLVISVPRVGSQMVMGLPGINVPIARAGMSQEHIKSDDQPSEVQ